MYGAARVERANYVHASTPFYTNSVEAEGKPFLAVPAGWRSDIRHVWRRCMPPSLVEESVPQSGWKIHISATPTEAKDTLNIVAKICEKHELLFKYLLNEIELQNSLKKYADRYSAGKFITVYPLNDNMFVDLLEILEQQLKGKKGPYILTDVKYGDAPVFFRYGAFGELPLANGKNGIITPDGKIVEDARDFTFSIPEFVQVPEAVRDVVQKRINGIQVGSDGVLAPYRVTGAIHYSFGGGVYKAINTDSDETVIIKEARKYSGYSTRTESAVERLRTEAEALKKLQLYSFVPRYIEYMSFDEHEFLVESFEDGVSLQSWLAANYPLTYENSFTKYEKDAIKILKQVNDYIEILHQAGTAFMDLKPENILIDEQLAAHFIDFESACSLADYSRNVVGTPGYIPYYKSNNAERDAYALYHLALYVLCPASEFVLTGGLEIPRHEFIAENYSQETLKFVEKLRCKIPDSLLIPRFSLSHVPSRQVALSKQLVSEYRSRIVESFGDLNQYRKNSSYLFPGDARQVLDVDSGSIDMENGVCGIMLSLARLGVSVKDYFPDDSLRFDFSSLSRHGLTRGALGAAYCLSEAGFTEKAQEIINNWQYHPTTNASLRNGLPGSVLALKSLEQNMERDAVLFNRMADNFKQNIKQNYWTFESADLETGKCIGLFDGWSGLALGCEAIYRNTGDIWWHQQAKKYLSREVDTLYTQADGSYVVDISGIHYGYLSGGTAGVGVACKLIDENEYKPIIDGISGSLTYRLSLNNGLFSGLAGCAGALMLLNDYESKEAQKQIQNLLRYKALSFSNESAIYFTGNDGYCLSMDYASGSAGIALVLEAYLRRVAAWMPWHLEIFGKIRKEGGDLDG